MKRVLLKLSGEIFSHEQNNNQKQNLIESIIHQIKDLQATIQFSITIGGGNLFRGAQAAPFYKIKRNTADLIGMFGTTMNGLLLQSLLEEHGIATSLLSSLYMPQIAQLISPSSIRQAFQERRIIIFCGGTGNPYVSSDTAAVIQAIQTESAALWKATKIDYLYDTDPLNNPDAKPILQCSLQEAIDRNLRVLDQTAWILANEHSLPIRIFNIFTPDALLKASSNENFGSTIHF